MKTWKENIEKKNSEMESTFLKNFENKLLMKTWKQKNFELDKHCFFEFLKVFVHMICISCKSKLHLAI
jgi:hypothetical protein